MHLERITDAAHPMYQAALRLYADSFPPHEQREAASQAEILRQNAYHFDLIYDGECFVGMLLYWEIGEWLYIEHFCTLPELRGHGYGQRALQLLQEMPLLLEIDPPGDEISLRRKHFYERCGFVENPYPHVHPPYHRGNAGHRLVVLSRPTPLPQTDYDAFARYLREVIMRDAFA